MGIFDFIDEQAANAVGDSVPDILEYLNPRKAEHGVDEALNSIKKAQIDTAKLVLKPVAGLFSEDIAKVSERMAAEDNQVLTNLHKNILDYLSESGESTIDSEESKNETEALKVESVTPFKEIHEQRISDIADKYGKTKAYFSGMSDEELFEYDQAMTGNRPLLWKK